MSEFDIFNEKLAGLIAALSPTQRRYLTRELSRKLRQNQQQRIKDQRSPDGVTYLPRKHSTIKGKKQRIKRAMFAKLRTSRFLKATSNDKTVVVEFTGKVQRIAQVHQFGLKDRPNQRSTAIDYPARPLLGFSAQDQQMIAETIEAYFAKR